MTNSVSTRKPTKKDMFNRLLNEYDLTPDLVEFVEHELDLLAKKNTTKDGAKRLTENQKGNIAIGEEIVSYMEIDHLYSVTELIKLVPSCAELSVPKVSAIIRPLRESGVLVKVEDKRKVFYKLA